MRKLAFYIDEAPYLFLNLVFSTFIIGMMIYSASGMHVVHCYFRETYGFECPSCGLSRAFAAMVHGDFSQAILFHRGAFWIFGFFVIQLFIRFSSFWIFKKLTADWIIIADIIISLSLLILCFGNGYQLL